MVVSVTASTTRGKPLPEENFQKTIDACDRALTLDEAKKKVFDFVESRKGYIIAPNLSAIVESVVAAKLMRTAGGLSALVKMPACNVQLLGVQKRNLGGLLTTTSQLRIGFVKQTEKADDVHHTHLPNTFTRPGRRRRLVARFSAVA